MRMSVFKTKSLQCGRAQHSGEQLHIAQHEIQQVSTCLGSMQTSDLSARAEVSNRSASAANAWLKLSKCLYGMVTISPGGSDAHSVR